MSYRILSLDGGGTWALIQVKALMDLYGAATTGHNVLNDFDLVAANSGGSIVLGCLLEDMPLSQILTFFQDESQRRAVFSETEWVGDRTLSFLTGLGPKYSAKEKLPALQHVLTKNGNVPLNQVVVGFRRATSANDLHLLIIGFDYDRDRGTYFRSSPAGGTPWGNGAASDITVAEAIHASTNAPVNYFDEPAQFPDHSGRYWDGAISGANNPVLSAVTEAIVKGQRPDDIVALSIGTGSVALAWPQDEDNPTVFEQPVGDSSLVADLKKLASSILDDPPDRATFFAHVLTRGGVGLNRPPADSRIVRMNPLVSPVKDAAGNWTAPGGMTTAQFQSLASLDMDAVKQAQVDAITRYADLWLQDKAPNQPIRMDGDTLKRELGQSKYSEAKTAWTAIK